VISPIGWAEKYPATLGMTSLPILLLKPTIFLYPPLPTRLLIIVVTSSANLYNVPYTHFSWGRAEFEWHWFLRIVWYCLKVLKSVVRKREDGSECGYFYLVFEFAGGIEQF
jgi:hypothetical protein